MKKEVFFIRDKETARHLMGNAFNSALRRLDSGAVVVTLSCETRTIEQNDKLWAMLTDLSKKITYYGKKRTTAAWKDIVTVAWQAETVELVPSFDNTKLIAVGLSTSDLGVKAFAEVVEVIYMMGADFGIEWSKKSNTIFKEYKLYDQVT